MSKKNIYRIFFVIFTLALLISNLGFHFWVVILSGMVSYSLTDLCLWIESIFQNEFLE